MQAGESVEPDLGEGEEPTINGQNSAFRKVGTDSFIQCPGEHFGRWEPW